jgi:hypothetical protein
MVPNGFYKIAYEGSTGSGFGMLALLSGLISGIDEAGVAYDGEYGEDDLTGVVQFHVRAIIPAGVGLVLGTPARDEAWSFAIDAVLPPGFASGTPVKLRTKFGPVRLIFALLRRLDLPSGPPPPM